MRELTLKDHPGASCWGVVMVGFFLPSGWELLTAKPGAVSPQKASWKGRMSGSWVGVNELEVIPGLDMFTVFKSGLKLMHTGESTVITDVPCTACLHSKRPSSPRRLWNVLLSQQRRGWRMLALLGSVTDMHTELLSQRNLQPKAPHWAWWAVEAPPCLKTWKHPRL